MIYVPAYWPLFKTHELRRFDYTGDGPFTSVFSYDVGTDSMLYNNYSGSGVWLNKWYYQYRTGFGIAEWRDDTPGKKVVMNPPIGWGEFQDVGSDYINKPAFDWFRSWPPAGGTGTQIVHFESHLADYMGYNDVIVFTYLQQWGNGAATGARYWMALGVGPIATQFLNADGTPSTSIFHAKVTRVNA